VIGPVPIGSISGVPILLGLSWIGLVPLVGFGLFVGIPVPSGSVSLRVTVAGLGVLLVLGSVIVHEVGHVFVARRRRVATTRVLVFALGGYSEIDLAGASPSSSIRILLAGPAVSAALGGFMIATALAVSPMNGGASEVLLTVGVINVGVAVFNLLPAFPLDGGRIVQAWLQLRGTPLAEARRKTSRGSSLVGIVLLVAGVAMSLVGSGASLLAVPLGVMLIALSRRPAEPQETADII
jgi:Zn-dependent protease